MEADIELDLSLVDLDICILEDKPLVSFDDSLSKTKAKLETWERSDCRNLMIIKRSISDTIRVGVPSR